MNSKSSYQLAYVEQLAQLFYAIAAADKQVSKQETEAFRTAISKEWEKVDFNEMLQKKFDLLLISKPAPEMAYDKFQEFAHKNPSLLTKSNKIKIWNTADAIASSFADKNKSEVVMLAKLKNLLLDLP